MAKTTEMADIEEVKSKREQLGERLKAKYPEREFADDDALFGQINDDYDEYDAKMQGYQSREKTLSDMFANDPRSAQFITDMAAGRDPWVGLINRIGIDGVKELLEDPGKMEEFSASNKEYVERLAKQKDLEEQWEQNMTATLKMLEEKQAEKGLTDDDLDSAADWIRDVTNDAVLGIIKPETIDMALKAINHDVDIDMASQEGEIRGKNAKIEEAKLRKPQPEETPSLGGASTSERSRQGGSIFDLAAEAQ